MNLFNDRQQVNDTGRDYLAGCFAEMVAFTGVVNISQRIVVTPFEQEITDTCA